MHHPQRARSTPAAAICILATAFALSALPPAARAAEPEPLTALIKRVTPGVVTIVAYNPDLAMPGIATGFLVAPDEVVTARHVFIGITRAQARTSDGAFFHIAGILAADPTGDLVLVKLEKPVPDAHVLTAAKSLPEPGERLLSIGSPLGLELTATEGIVSAVRQMPSVGPIIQHSAPVSIGSSGCPLLNAHGEVLAVQTAILTVGQKTVSAGQGLNFASPAQRLARMSRGALRPLADCAADEPKDWVPPITRGIDALALYPLTRDDFKSSLAFFQESTKLEPAEPDSWFRLGLCEEKLGDRPAAVESYKKAIALRPPSAIPYNNLGVLYIQNGSYAQAIELLQQAVKMNPGYTEAFASLAVAYLQLKQYPEAIRTATEALRTNTKHVPSHFTLGRAYLESGDRAKATEQYQALLPLDKPRADELHALMDKH